MLASKKNKASHSSHTSSTSNTTSSLFKFDSTKSSDMLKQIRETRRLTNTHISSKKQRPFIIRCFIPALIALILMYIFLFVEVGELQVDLFHFLHEKSVDILPEPVHVISIENLDVNNSAQYVNYNDDKDNSQFVAMWHYIHESDFNQLSPALQTRKLHELFRYKYNDIVIERMKNGNVKTPTDYELAVIMTDLYNSWHQSEVNFIQIGACDGNWKESNDPIQKLVLTKPNWHGVMMEPVPYLFDTLKQNIAKDVVEYEHRIVPINAALSDEDGTQTFYIVNEHFAEELPNESHALKYQIGSFNKQHIVKHIGIKKERGQLSQELDHYISAIQVKSMTPNSVLQIFKQSGKAARDGAIDVLSIDAEGYDYMVLKQFLHNTSIRPLLIMYENLHLSAEHKKLAIESLQEHGYMVFGIGWNTLGVRVANI